MPFNTTALNLMLDALDEGAASGITHIGIGGAGDPGSGTNYAGAAEASGGSYARQSVTWGAAASGVKANSNALTFNMPAGTWLYFLLFSASTGNTSVYKGYFPFGGSVLRKGFAAIDSTLANDQLICPGHGLSDGNQVIVYNTTGGALATGLTEGTVYYVVSGGVNTFKLSATLGGSPVDITGAGNGSLFWQQVVPESLGSPGTFTVDIGALALDLTGV